MKREPNGTFARRGDAERDAGRGVEARVIDPLILPPAPRPEACQQFVKEQIASSMPELCQVLIAMALNEDLGAFKLLWQMAELDRKVTGAGPGKTDLEFARKAMAEFHAR